jgi:hypothetical protein
MMASFALAMAWALRPPPDRVLKLADGCEVILKAVTFGTEHRYVAGKPWFKMLAPVIPARWHARLGLKVVTHRSGTPSLVAWVQWRGGGPNQREFTDASVFDGHGFESEPHRAVSTVFLQDRPRGAVRAWEFAHFPRRGKTVGLRLYTRGAAYNADLLAEFRFPNPARQKYPSWKASPLPSTRHDGGWAFSLTKFTTGEPIPEKLKPSRGWVAPWTAATFRVTEGGLPTDAWMVAGIEARDATGNVSYFSSAAVERKDGKMIFGFNAPLWPDEPAWKLKVEFSRVTEFAENEVFVVSGVPLPEPGGKTLVRTQAVVQGAQVTFETLSRSVSARSFQGIRGNAEASLHLVPTEGRRLILAQATDEHGHVVQSVLAAATSGGGSEFDLADRSRVQNRMLPNAGPEGWYNFMLEVPAVARSLTFTFAAPKSRFLEFVARPEVVTNSITAQQR